MYTIGDELVKQSQQKEARDAIQTIAANQSGKKRMKNLMLNRQIFQSFGWQDSIDIIEDQMVVWGRKEYKEGENQHWYEVYQAALREFSLPEKALWTDTDHYVCGQARACSEARYVVRFWPYLEVAHILEDIRRKIEGELADPVISSTDRLKCSCCVNLLQEFIRKNHS